MAAFLNDPFDVAPDAPRYTPLAWLILGLGVLAVLVCTFQLASTVLNWQRTESDLTSVRAAREHAARRQSSSPAAESPQELETKLALQRVLRLSWTSLFATLEAAGQRVQGRATVTELLPVKLRDDAIEVHLTGLAVSPDIMLEYLRALQGQQRVHDVQLTHQQPTTRGAAEVVRFQATLQWLPESGTDSVMARPDPQLGR